MHETRQANPLEIQIWRGDASESRHRVHAVVCDDTGAVRSAWGDPSLRIYPRSSIKMLQVLPLLESGAAAAYDVSERELALACSSHSGEPVHQELAGTWLKRLGLDKSALKCGGHMPYHQPSALAEHARLGHFDILGDNCSGKHVGMLCTGLHLGESVADYCAASHPVQLRVRDRAAEICGYDLARTPWGIDGCGIPTYLMPLERIAYGMARFATGRGLDAATAERCRLVFRAMSHNPELVGGTGEYVTDTIRALDGRGIVKIGAEGVMTASLPSLGLGVALKAEDGAERAVNAAMTWVLTSLGLALPPRPLLRNRPGVAVGHVEVVS